eukprot:2687720-Rhodomonas_salina.1
MPETAVAVQLVPGERGIVIDFAAPYLVHVRFVRVVSDVRVCSARYQPLYYTLVALVVHTPPHALSVPGIS